MRLVTIILFIITKAMIIKIQHSLSMKSLKGLPFLRSDLYFEI